MATVEQINERVEELTRRHGVAKERKSKLAGKLDEKKAELVRLKKDIEAHGYSAKDLKFEKEKLEAELVTLMDEFDKDLVQVEDALAEYEK